MAKLVPITGFVRELRAALNRKDGYIMGATGQNPKTWSTGSWWFTQYTGSQKQKALYWREHAARVWDCNGLAEGIYKDLTGVDINTKARYNYSGWCSPKGKGLIPAEYRVPGAAVFWSDGTAGDIHHVAYLDAPVTDGKPSGDWWIIEARGVNYGVVRTKLSARKPNFWGLMSKYFDYTGTVKSVQAVERVMRKGDKGEDVRQLQRDLMAIGYALPKYGADGDFGGETLDAVKAFQTAHGLTVNGEVDEKTRTALATALLEVPGKTLTVTTGSWNVRDRNGTDGKVLTVVHGDDVLAYISTHPQTGWHYIAFEGVEGWISPKAIVKE